jgi:hypothetical protein
METISLTTFRKLSSRQIEDGPCLRVTSDGINLFYVIIKPQQAMQAKVEGICSQIDAGRGNPAPQWEQAVVVVSESEVPAGPLASLIDA